MRRVRGWFDKFANGSGERCDPLANLSNHPLSKHFGVDRRTLKKWGERGHIHRGG